MHLVRLLVRAPATKAATAHFRGRNSSLGAFLELGLAVKALQRRGVVALSHDSWAYPRRCLGTSLLVNRSVEVLTPCLRTSRHCLTAVLARRASSLLVTSRGAVALVHTRPQFADANVVRVVVDPRKVVSVARVS